VGTDLPTDWDDTGPAPDFPSFDFEVDPVVLHEEDEQAMFGTADDEPLPITDPELDNAVVEFVDLLNARDIDALAELFAADAEASSLGEASAEGIIDALAAMVWREPDLVVTRGDMGIIPVAPAWILDPDTDRYQLAGLFKFELSDQAEGMIGRLEYVGEDTLEDAVFEVPDDSERAEWEDRSTQDEA
jgi:hypothetical protein